MDETHDLTVAYLRVHLQDYRTPIIVATLLACLPVLAYWVLFGSQIGPLAAIAVLSTGISERSITAFAGRHMFGNPATVRGAWTATFRKLPFILVTLLTTALPQLMVFASDFDEDWMVGAAMLATVWPFIVASHLHISEVNMLEHLTVNKSAQRARALVRYRFARALGLLTTSGLVRALFVVSTYSAAMFLLSVILQFQGASENLGAGFAVLGYALAGPYLALVRFFDYIDSRTRREGWDIQVRFNAIAQKRREARQSERAA
jgi:hypothetical protein